MKLMGETIYILTYRITSQMRVCIRTRAMLAVLDLLNTELSSSYKDALHSTLSSDYSAMIIKYFLNSD